MAEASPVASDGVAGTLHAADYVERLRRHWSHKLEVTTGDGGAVRIVMRSGAVVRLLARADSVAVSIEAASPAQLAETQAVVVDHLDRFAFREAPLGFVWTARPERSVRERIRFRNGAPAAGQ